jgi:hypothetical protein
MATNSNSYSVLGRDTSGSGIQVFSDQPPSYERKAPSTNTTPVPLQNEPLHQDSREYLVSDGYPVAAHREVRFIGVLRGWFWELISAIISLAALFGLLIILHKYNGRPQEEWTYKISINTLISVLSTIIRVSSLVPVAEGLSQLKWSWFEGKAHALDHMVVFDKASRSPFGGFWLLFTIAP